MPFSRQRRKKPFSTLLPACLLRQKKRKKEEGNEGKRKENIRDRIALGGEE